MTAAQTPIVVPAEIQTWVAANIVKENWHYYDDLITRCARDLKRDDVQAYWAQDKNRHLRVSRSVKRSAELFLAQCVEAFRPYIGEN
jgi:hypothetical protein